MKRAVIDNAGRFRISKPGFDVDTAAAQDMLLHESFFFSQPFLWRYVPCPFAGYFGTDVREESAPAITFASTGLVPTVLTFGVAEDGIITYPGRNSAAAGSAQTGYALRSWIIYHSVTTTSVTITFRKNPNNNYSPQGAYVVLFRKGNNA